MVASSQRNKPLSFQHNKNIRHPKESKPEVWLQKSENEAGLNRLYGVVFVDIGLAKASGTVVANFAYSRLWRRGRKNSRCNSNDCTGWYLVAESKRIRQAKLSKTRVVIGCIALAESSGILVASRTRTSFKRGNNIKKTSHAEKQNLLNVQSWTVWRIIPLTRRCTWPRFRCAPPRQVS